MSKLYCNDYYVIEHNNNDILFHIPTNTMCKISKEIVKYMNNKNIKLSSNKYSSLFNNLDTKEKICFPAKSKNKEKLGNLVFLSSSKCNLKCSYCYANEGTYNEENGTVMTFDKYKEILNFVLDKFKKGIESICFFGGEPLIGFQNIKSFVEYCNQICLEKEIPIPKYGIITNGTLITDEMIQFFNQYNLNITISIDGTKEINDKARISDNYTSVFDVIQKNIKNINMNRRFKFAIEATITKHHINAYKKGIVKEWLDELCKFKFDTMLFAPVSSCNPEIMITENDKTTLQEIFKEYVDYWFEKIVYTQCNTFPIEILTQIVNIISNRYTKDCNLGGAMFVNNNGEIYPCQLFYQSRSLKIGSIYNDTFYNFNKISHYIQDMNRSQVDECKSCPARNLCTYWCRGDSLLMNGKFNSVNKVRCWAEIAILDSILINLNNIWDDLEKYNNFVLNIKNLSALNKR